MTLAKIKAEAEGLAKLHNSSQAGTDAAMRELAALVAALAEGLRRGGGASEESGWKEDK